MKLSQKLPMDGVSNQAKPYPTKPNHTKPNHTKPTLNLLYPKQPTVLPGLVWYGKVWFDIDETFTEASDGCCLKPNLTIPNETNAESFLKQPKQVGS